MGRDVGRNCQEETAGELESIYYVEKKNLFSIKSKSKIKSITSGIKEIAQSVKCLSHNTGI